MFLIWDWRLVKIKDRPGACSFCAFRFPKKGRVVQIGSYARWQLQPCPCHSQWWRRHHFMVVCLSCAKRTLEMYLEQARVAQGGHVRLAERALEMLKKEMRKTPGVWVTKEMMQDSGWELQRPPGLWGNY